MLRALGDRVSHASDHEQPAALAGKDVTIIGVGQSATELGALLTENGATVRLVGRRGITWLEKPPPFDRPLRQRIRQGPIGGLAVGWKSWAMEHLAWGYPWLPQQKRVYLARKKHGPAAAWWLRDRIEGKVDVLTGRNLRAAANAPGGVQLTFWGPEGDDEVIETEHVIACTGYRVDLHRLRFLDPRLRRRIRTLVNSPLHSSGFESSVPGFHVVGMAAATTFGPVMRFVVGTEFASPRLARHLARHRKWNGAH